MSWKEDIISNTNVILQEQKDWVIQLNSQWGELDMDSTSVAMKTMMSATLFALSNIHECIELAVLRLKHASLIPHKLYSVEPDHIYTRGKSSLCTKMGNHQSQS